MSVLLALGGVSLTAAAPSLTGDKVPTADGDLIIHPVQHATLVLQWKGHTIYVDPVGGAARFEGLPSPALILVTDIHGDHLHPPTLEALAKEATTIVAPAAVTDQLPPALRQKTRTLANGQKTSLLDLTVEAVPAYNLTQARLQYHAKGRGNGYLLTLGAKRIYLSGDTEDIPEMRALSQIDVAFLCMNLPYTMDVDQAASAVRQFKPRIVYPYHYRGSDLDKFKNLVGTDLNIEVRTRDWYQPQAARP